MLELFPQYPGVRARISTESLALMPSHVTSLKQSMAVMAIGGWQQFIFQVGTRLTGSIIVGASKVTSLSEQRNILR